MQQFERRISSTQLWWACYHPFTSGLMKNFVKAMDRTSSAFRYLHETFPWLSKAKSKERVLWILRSTSFIPSWISSLTTVVWWLVMNVFVNISQLWNKDTMEMVHYNAGWLLLLDTPEMFPNSCTRDRDKMSIENRKSGFENRISNFFFKIILPIKKLHI